MIRSDAGPHYGRGPVGRAWRRRGALLALLGAGACMAAWWAAAAASPPPIPHDVFITIDWSGPVATSHFQTGVTHTQYSADAWGDPQAVGAAGRLLVASTVFQNQHIMGWGAGNPEPAPGVFDWRDLDGRVALVRASGGIPVLTLCCAPDWMKGGLAGTTDWSQIEEAPTPDHYADYAELARQVALRYPDVRYFQVWNELKGFFNTDRNRWDYEGYTRLYNAVYDAVKAANPAAKLGGPYVVLDTDLGHTQHHPSELQGNYGTVDARALDAISYWLAHKHGADFICLDGTSNPRTGGDPFAATQFYSDVATWIRSRTSLPIWWSEWSAANAGGAAAPTAQQDALQAAALAALVQSGAETALKWGPQGSVTADGEAMWSDTRQPGGGQPFPYYFTQKTIHDYFSAGASLYRAVSSSAYIRVLATDRHVLLVNSTGRPITVHTDGEVVALAGYEIRVAVPNAPSGSVPQAGGARRAATP